MRYRFMVARESVKNYIALLVLLVAKTMSDLINFLFMQQIL